MTWALAVEAAAQGAFRITFQAEPSGADQTRVSGSVFNGDLREVLDVYVTVEALDDRGKVVARGITFVAPVIQPQQLVTFSASVPARTKAQRFKVYVSSFNYGLRARPESP